jgi:hypothetical protein
MGSTIIPGNILHATSFVFLSSYIWTTYFLASLLRISYACGVYVVLYIAYLARPD